MSFQLPAVGGRTLHDCTLSEFERRCLISLMHEQEKINPDNVLTALFCDAVRITREYSDKIGNHPKEAIIKEWLSQFGLRPEDVDEIWKAQESAADEINTLKLKLTEMEKRARYFAEGSINDVEVIAKLTKERDALQLKLDTLQTIALNQK